MNDVFDFAEGTTSLPLLSRARGGDEAAWRTIVDLYSPMILNWCRRWHMQPHDAEDITQDVLASAFRNLPTFDRRKHGSFRSWLYTITRHRALDVHSRQKRENFVGTRALNDTAEIVEDESEQNELFVRCVRFIKTEFTNRDAEIVERLVMYDHDVDAIAAEFQIAPATVRVIKFRVISRVAQEFSGLVDIDRLRHW